MIRPGHLLNRPWSLWLAITVVALLLIGVAQAATPQSSLSSAQSRAAGFEIVTGTLVDTVGSGVSGEVFLFVQPPFTKGSAKLPLISRTTTDTKGHFVFRTENSALLSKIAQPNDSWINFDVVAATGGFVVYRGRPRQYNAKTRSWIGPDNTIDLGNLVASKGAPGVLLRQRDTQSVAVGNRVGRTTLAAPCSVLRVTPVAAAPQLTVVGELHTTLDMQATFTYGSTADSDIDIGFSTAFSGPWSMSGSRHVGNQSSGEVTWSKGENFHRKLLTSFMYAKYRKVGCAGTYYTVEAVEWRGGALAGGPADDPTARCRGIEPLKKVPQGRGTAFKRESSRAVRHGVSATIFGVSLGATSGYSTHVKAHWKFGSARDHFLCGDTGPPASAMRIFAGN